MNRLEPTKIWEVFSLQQDKENRKNSSLFLLGSGASFLVSLLFPAPQNNLVDLNALWRVGWASVGSFSGLVAVGKTFDDIRNYPYKASTEKAKTVMYTNALGAMVAGQEVVDRHYYIPRAKEALALQEELPEDISEMPLEAPQLPVFDWQLFRDKPNDFPHIIIVGATGDGKSSLAEYLGVLPAENTKRFAIAPHKKPGDWQGFDGIFGAGRNYGNEGQIVISEVEKEKLLEGSQKPSRSKKVIAEYSPVEYQDLIDGTVKTPTVAQVLDAIFWEMDRRYKLYAEGDENYEFHDWYLDEIPAIAKVLGKRFTEAVGALIMEARKVKIRLWLLAQGQTVKILGLEGASDLKESLTFIWMKSFAVDHAQMLVNKGRLTPAAVNWLENCDRPCMVDNKLAKIPSWDEMRSTIAAKVSAKDTTRHQMQQVATNGHKMTQNDTNGGKVQHKDILQAELVTEDDTDVPEWSDLEKKLYYQATEAVKKGQTKADIIKKTWGYGTLGYAKGRQVWERLGLDRPNY